MLVEVAADQDDLEDEPGSPSSKARGARGKGPKAPSPGHPGTSPPLRAAPHRGASTRSVPAFGYELSRKMGCRLSELLRDCAFPLTKYSRAVLVGGTAVADARTVADKVRVVRVRVRVNG